MGTRSRKRNLEVVLFACLLTSAGCSGTLSRTAAVKQIRASTEVRAGANTFVNLGLVAPITARRSSPCIGYPSESQHWAEKYGYVNASSEESAIRISLTIEGKQIASTLEQTVGVCESDYATFHIGTIDEIDVMEVFTDGPRAKVQFEYEISPLNHGEDVLSNNPVGPAGLGAITVGTDSPRSFTKTPSGKFSNFGTALFELTDNGWTLKKLTMDSSGQ